MKVGFFTSGGKATPAAPPSDPGFGSPLFLRCFFFSHRFFISPFGCKSAFSVPPELPLIARAGFFAGGGFPAASLPLIGALPCFSPPLSPDVSFPWDPLAFPPNPFPFIVVRFTHPWPPLTDDWGTGAAPLGGVLADAWAFSGILDG